MRTLSYRQHPARCLWIALVAALAVALAVASAAPAAGDGRRGALSLRAAGVRVSGQYQPAPGHRDIAARFSTSRRAEGVDVIVTMRNTGAEPQRLGSVSIGPIHLGDNPTHLALGMPGRTDEPIQGREPVCFGVYPGSMYAPVAAVESSTGVVGLSIQYPVLERRHEVGLSLVPAGPAAWEVVATFYGSPPGQGLRIGHPALLAPGASARYIISIRTAPVGQWRLALDPYRAYFQQTYGQVAYKRDPRPVRGYTIAGTWAVSPANPRGFVDSSGRPDLNGWGGLVDDIITDPTGERVMLWAPSGVFRNNGAQNYPFQFTTGWRTGVGPGSRLGEAVDELPRVGRAGRDLGLWWGRSAQVMRGWDQAGFENLDPSNPDHRFAAFMELDLAVRAGATTIGLDAFSHHWTPVWELHDWLEAMQRRAPNVRFVTEGLAPDVLHVASPSSTIAYAPEQSRDAEPGSRRITGPFHLADLLVPGHETWAFGRFDLLAGALDRAVTSAEVDSEIQFLIDAGYVPVAFSSADLPELDHDGDN